MEAALKLKEVSYVFSEAYAAGELKHGPIALLQEGRLVVATITQPNLLDKTLSNLREVKARGAYVLAICREDLREKVIGEADELVLVHPEHADNMGIVHPSVNSLNDQTAVYEPMPRNAAWPNER